MLWCLQIDELDALVTGFRLMLTDGPQNEIFSLANTKLSDGKLLTKRPIQSPQCSVASSSVMLVNIGSGVSMLKVNPDGSFERVGGTSMGGCQGWDLHRTGLLVLTLLVLL